MTSEVSAAARRQVSISKVVVGDDEIEAVVEVLRSGQLREGPQCRAFEEEFARSVGAAHALTVSSGTAALHMAYSAVLQPGDEILVPAFTFFATASMVLAVGAVPVFCDIDPATLTLDPGDVARRITKRTRAIAPVHLFGNPADVAAIQDLADQHGLAVVWDAAQAHGALYGGKDVGSYDDIVCYSFYPSKNMTTGEGGMACTNNAELASAMRLVRSQGEQSRYRHVTLGYNFRMTDFQAAIGRGQLRKLPLWTDQRRRNAAYLRGRLTDTPLLQVQTEQPNGAHVYHQFTVLVDRSVDRDTFIASLRDAGIETGVHYPVPQHQQPAFASSTAGVTLPASEDAASRVVSLPVHPYLSKDDLAYVADQALAAAAIAVSP